MSAQGVRKILSRGPADFEALAKTLDIAQVDRAGRRDLRKDLWDLIAAGAVVKEVGANGAPPRYRLTERQKQRGEVQARLAKALKLRGRKGQITHTQDLSALAGCSREFAKRYLRFLKNAGYLVEAGAVKLSKFGLGISYRVAPGREGEAPPWFSRRAEEKKQGSGVRGQGLAKEQVAAVMAEIRGAVEMAQSRVQRAATGSLVVAARAIDAAIDAAIEAAFAHPLEILEEMVADLEKISDQ
jgi:hypothetical protein